ncbi:Pyridine nucleotide-disulfide oxidoreductase domain-containing protein 1 [Fasciola gigantica]|uniref:Pyridine nucleotide-disulfide oxidoreductase domain-containing protein 1 n=1 Tax=Fasciola gigantica TaxID=46835 RepID=A0A504YLZ7_FASGI|nr:Pyridine nucleotide-disulfide oxidoreductase domain-containing protein 1 [Fasciola gigantica]
MASHCFHTINFPDTRRLVLVGNGGIATEIAHEVLGCQVVWTIKDSTISTPFLDPSAARFLLDARDRALRSAQKSSGPDQTGDQSGPTKIRRMRYVVSKDSHTDSPAHLPGSSDTESQLILVPDSCSNPSSATNKASSTTTTKPVGVALGPDWAFWKWICTDRFRFVQ